MKTLTLRIYFALLATLLLFALSSSWLYQRHIEQERALARSLLADRMAAWGELIQRSLPPADAPLAEQADALRAWSERLRLPLALDGSNGERIGASNSFERIESRRIGPGGRPGFAVSLEDGRTLWLMRPGRGALTRAAVGQGSDNPMEADGTVAPSPRGGIPPMGSLKPGWQGGAVGLVALLLGLFLAVAAAAWPVARALTRRLDALRQGVEKFGEGRLQQRVEVSGRDEVAALAVSFNRAAERIETLVRSHQSLLANASHELRSPLTRLKMAVSLLQASKDDPAQGDRFRQEILDDIAELDALVEEVLLASRLDSAPSPEPLESVDLLGLVAEEAARVDAAVEGVAATVSGNERLLRRALRNLLENAQRYGGKGVRAEVIRQGDCVTVLVCDRGFGVPAEFQERVFEPFFRLPGHAEQAGGVGLGLSLVRQIAQSHKGKVRCRAAEGGGSCFELTLPVSPEEAWPAPHSG